jgi:NADH:ubiquinone oxidoreductase subunit F (NADH-binding)/NADH:ubiquinone oxidoreductase subunit E
VIFDDLRTIQTRHGFLPKAELETLSRRTNTPLYQIHSVASFYPHFQLAIPPKADLRICADMSCHLNGSAELRNGLLAAFSNSPAEDVLIRDVSCLGRCDGAPAISLNDHILTCASLGNAEQRIRAVMRGELMAEPAHLARATPCKTDPYPSADKYGAVRELAKTQAFGAVLASLKDAELRGMGGAGFPTSVKWDLVRKQAGAAKYIVCNADESEPGTIKDRFILTHIPHLVIEGMIVAGLVTGANKGVLYIRHEYHAQEEILRTEIAKCYAAGLLGKKICGSSLDFDLEVFVSPGGYINNVETFANVPQILVRGAEWYKAQGHGGSRGLKFVGVSGHVARPGVFEVPAGIPMREVIFNYAGGIRDGKSLKAFAPSGPSSGYLPASMLDVRLDFKALADAGSMLGSGAIVVCDETTCMLDMALNAVRFYRNESCGKCVPCRVGSQKMTDLLERWRKSAVSEERYRADLSLLDELSQAMTLTSICGLGQIAPAPIQSVLKHFRSEIDRHVLSGQCPSGICLTESTTTAASQAQRVGIQP